jgi:Tfp pilus assembly protein PilX
MSVNIRNRQTGATLVVGLIMLVLITLVVTTAYTLSSTNLKSVGNMQFRDEALAAANMALEQMMGTTFATMPTAATVEIDLNRDGDNDYTVEIPTPTCISGAPVTWTSSNEGNQSSAELEYLESGVNTHLLTVTYYNTIWDIKATVTDLTSGATVQVHQGVRAAPMTEAQFTAVCS